MPMLVKKYGFGSHVAMRSGTPLESADQVGTTKSIIEPFCQWSVCELLLIRQLEAFVGVSLCVWLGATAWFARGQRAG